jgi:hypothetical protein
MLYQEKSGNPGRHNSFFLLLLQVIPKNLEINFQLLILIENLPLHFLHLLLNDQLFANLGPRKCLLLSATNFSDLELPVQVTHKKLRLGDFAKYRLAEPKLAEN